MQHIRKNADLGAGFIPGGTTDQVGDQGGAFFCRGSMRAVDVQIRSAVFLSIVGGSGIVQVRKNKVVLNPGDLKFDGLKTVRRLQVQFGPGVKKADIGRPGADLAFTPDALGLQDSA